LQKGHYNYFYNRHSMIAFFNMTKQKICWLLIAALSYTTAFSQATFSVTDADRKYKAAKDLFVQERYALAYPLLRDLAKQYPANMVANHTYINDDIAYYYTVCGLKLEHPVAVAEAEQYLAAVNNEPRRQLMAYHLGKYYFSKDEFAKAIDNYDRAALDNLSNDEIADAKFEKGYCYFNLRRFEEARPLFDEVHQLSNNKYYIPANYYHGFIAYYERRYAEALRSFKLVETAEEYKGVVPYYIAEIYYFQGKKDEALRYAESILGKGGYLYYAKDLKLLVGQMYFEKKDFARAMPMLEEYVNNSDKVSKEVLYELSFCYYNANQLPKAIEGFKQLSGQKDSLGQNSMYLLADCYLRTNQKANARTAFQYCAYNSSNAVQQEISRFNYGKLSYELGYQDIALDELKRFIGDYPNSTYGTEAREILVNLLANTNNFADALALYESFGQPTPAMQRVYPKILYGRAIEYINEQQVDRADELLGKVLTNANSGALLPYANFWKGEIAYRNNRYDDAIRHLSAYAQSGAGAQGEANPTTARYNLGYSWLKKENYRQALSFFEQVATTVSPTSTPMQQDAYVRSADCYYMNRDFAKANAMYDNVLSSALPQSDYALLQKAMIAGIKSSADKIKTLNNLTKQYPQSGLVPDANMEVANTYMADEKFRDAIPYLNTLLTMPGAESLRPKTYLRLGLCWYNIDKNKEALDNYQALVQKFPESAEADEALDNIKTIYVEEGRPNDYVDLMRRSGKNISVSEADSLTYNAAELKYNAGDCRAAIAGYTNYLSQYANGAFALEASYFRGECHTKLKEWPNAVASFEYVTNKGQSKYFDRATLSAAQTCYFELKDYAKAKQFFEALRVGAVNQDNQLEALRGLVRCYYQLKDYTQANEAAKQLVGKKGISADDRAIGWLVLGKSQQLANNCAEAINSFKSCAAISKNSWGAEARYEIANCQFAAGNTAAAEKSAMAVIKETGSHDYWVTKAYILLGDIFMQQKDYFNAKATYESVALNASSPELKTEAQQKLERAVAEEKANSKLGN
jgi:tetratricopeptide (TPR) repeat protein